MAVNYFEYSRRSLKDERARLEREIQNRYGPIQWLDSLSIEELEDTLRVGSGMKVLHHRPLDAS